jgi:type IV fimbrial biogenesis protein FimT
MSKEPRFWEMLINTKGFTILELLIGLSILAITMAISVPSFITLISDNRISGNSNDLVSSLLLAKAESAARAAPVTICKKNVAGTGCLTTGNWQQGWLVFSDVNGDGSLNGGDNVISNHEALDARITFIGTAGVADFITFRPSGTTSIASTEVMIMCDDRGFAASAKGILITITGRGSVMKANETGQTTCL